MEKCADRSSPRNKVRAWLFVLMIDDIDTTNTDLWKYVDDTTAAEMVEKGETRMRDNVVTKKNV